MPGRFFALSFSCARINQWYSVGAPLFFFLDLLVAWCCANTFVQETSRSPAQPEVLGPPLYLMALRLFLYSGTVSSNFTFNARRLRSPLRRKTLTTSDLVVNFF